MGGAGSNAGWATGIFVEERCDGFVVDGATGILTDGKLIEALGVGGAAGILTDGRLIERLRPGSGETTRGKLGELIVRGGLAEVTRGGLGELTERSG